ncbi:MAG TPA: alpha/beta hydrolase [Cyclobacteriaceae bacterium]|jgi:pimeloyl-ACP methyl ester carboxylesterase|nr:alpha/beta hydrolase [Cyclobacteriaceae bacterium]
MIETMMIWRNVLLLIPFLALISCGSSQKEETAKSEEARKFFAYDTSLYEPVQIDYHIYGENDTTLLFIHGWNLNQTYWANQVTSLSKRFTVVTLDLAGHGNSGRDRKNWTVEAFAKDILSIIEKESLNQIILVGHSIGGEIALDVCRRAPEKIVGFIGIDNFKDIDFDITPEFKKGFERYLGEFEVDYNGKVEELAARNCKVEDAEIVTRIEEDYKSADPNIAVQILKNMVPYYDTERKRLRKIKVPLHIIASDLSPYNLVALDRYAKAGYSIEWIRGSGHFPMIEKPKPFQRAFEKTLTKILLKSDSLPKAKHLH